MKFNLGDRVVALVYGEVTEVRMVAGSIKYTVTNKDYEQAFVLEPSLTSTQERKVDATTNKSI